jgi:hypothetical protein
MCSAAPRPRACVEEQLACIDCYQQNPSVSSRVVFVVRSACLTGRYRRCCVDITCKTSSWLALRAGSKTNAAADVCSLVEPSQRTGGLQCTIAQHVYADVEVCNRIINKKVLVQSVQTPHDVTCRCYVPVAAAGCAYVLIDG